jgi:hypothetical protein
VGLEFAGRRSWVGALPPLIWLVLAALAAVQAWLAWPRAAQAVELAPLAAYAVLYAFLALATWRGSRWAVLAAEFHFIANTVSLAAGWTPPTLDMIAATALFGIAVAIGFEQWPALHWGVLTALEGDRADARTVWARLKDFFADVPLTLLIGGLGLAAILLIWGISIILTYALAGDPRSVTLAFMTVPALGLAGGTLLTALARLSRVAALVAVVVPLLYVADNSRGSFDPLHAAPSSLVLALLLLPHWGRMTWRLWGYETLPRGVAQAFS